MTDVSRYHLTVKKIIDVLDGGGVTYKTFEHEEVRTSEEAANVRDGYSLKEGAKALIVRVEKKGEKEKQFAQIVIPGDSKFSASKARKVLDAKDIRFASEEQVLEITNGVKPGGVPPFGNLFGLPVYADSGIFENEEIVFNAGDRRFSIAFRTDDYRRVVGPIVADLV